MNSDVRIIVLGNYSPSGHDASRIVDENGVAPTVKENHGTVTAVATEGRSMNKDIAPVLVGGVGEINFGKQYRQGNRIYDANSIAVCLLSRPVGNAGGFSYLYRIGDSNMTTSRIRKLTPKECFRLMGFDDEDFYKAEAVNSNTQLYKQAGNSIVVDVIVKIYEKLSERYGDVIK